jgi:hypothetical protein
MPNYTSVAQVLINSVPSAPFSMDWIPLMGHPNKQLADALKRLSAAKYGRPRAIVEAEIVQRLHAADIAREEDKKKRLEAMRNSSIPVPGKAQSTVGSQPGTPSGSTPGGSPSGNQSFLDDWLAKRQQVKPSSSPDKPQVSPVPPSVSMQDTSKPEPAACDVKKTTELPSVPDPLTKLDPPIKPAKSEAEIEAEISEELRIARSQAISETSEKRIIQSDIDTVNAKDELVLSDDNAGEIFIDVRGNIHQSSDDN